MSDLQEKLVNQAQQFNERGEWEKALECYQEIYKTSDKPAISVCKSFGFLIRKTVMRPGISRNLNSELDQLNYYTSLYKKSLEFYPKNLFIYRYLGSTLAYLHRFDEAIKYFNRAIELSSEHPTWVLEEFKLCQARQEYISQPNNQNIYFLHIHKAAGTTFVNLARQNLCKFYKQYKNGNPWNKNELIQFWKFDPDEQVKFLASPDYNFIANETCLGPHILHHTKIAYITILRNPLDRILSDFKHRRKAGDYPEDMLFHEFIDSEIFPSLRWTNNFLIRTFIKDSSKKIIDERDLKLAKERLSQFNHVFFVESFQEDIIVMKQFGWIMLDTDKYRSGSRANSNAVQELQNSDGTLNKLVERNKLDLEFYEYARSARQKPNNIFLEVTALSNSFL